MKSAEWLTASALIWKIDIWFDSSWFIILSISYHGNFYAFWDEIHLHIRCRTNYTTSIFRWKIIRYLLHYFSMIFLKNLYVYKNQTVFFCVIELLLCRVSVIVRLHCHMIFIRNEVENIYYFISQVYDELMMCLVANFWFKFWTFFGFESHSVKVWSKY